MADQTFAVHCGFFDAIDSDRTYSADEMNRPYRRVISNGVFATPQGNPSTDLQVVESTGMNIICKAGEGLFADKWFENPSSIVITVPNNTSTVPRIDSVLVQVDTRTSGRVGNIVHRTGTPASSPVPPAINQTEGVVEYRLANIRVNAGVTSIQGRYITDRRGSSDCPWVTSLIYQVDTSTLYDQWQAAYAEYFETEKAIWDAWYAQLTEDLDVSMTLDRRTNTVTTTPQTTGTIPIGLEYNNNTDLLEVYINGLRAVEGTHYVVVDGGTSIMLENQLDIGQTVTFVVLKSVISGNAESMMTILHTLEEKIASVAGGTPTVVDNVSDMTDTDKVYILSTDGKWYYYSATLEDWVIGGTYGGVPTDTTLTQEGMAADAKAVGDALTEVSEEILGLETYKTLTPSFEQGTISSSYKPADNANRIRTVDAFEVDDIMSAECDSGHSIWWAEYRDDMSGNALHMKGTLKLVTPDMFAEGTVYVRFVLVNSASATPITPTDSFTFGIKISRVSKVDSVIEKVDEGFTNINLIDDTDWEIGGFDERGFLQAVYRMRTSSLYHVKAGDKIIFAIPSDITGSVKYEIGFYENDVLTSLSGKISTNYTFDNDYDIRIAIGLAGSYAPVNFELKRCVGLYAATYSDSIVSRTSDPLLTAGRVIQRRQNMGLPFEYHNHYTFGDSIACDFFFMGNDLWTFSASANDNSTSVSYAVRTYDPATDTFTFKSSGLHNLGHVNSMSYSEGNDCLICGNGSDDYTLSNKFFVCPNLSELVGNIDINTNCIVYDCSALDLGNKLNVIWGDANKGNYDIAYGITDDNAHIYKILLGRGTNALTYGTLISGKSDTEFNGTFAIVETYSQDVCGYETCVQGSTYFKGSIYAGIGHNVGGIRLWKMTPQRDGSIHTEEHTEQMWGQDMVALGNVGGISTWNNTLVFISMGSGNVYSYDV